MTPAEARRMAALEQRLATLENRSKNASGLGRNTAYGVEVYRTTQLGFEVELTTSYSAATGYGWKRLKLVPGSEPFVNPGIQARGSQAYSYIDDVALTPGTIGWLEPSPDAVGYILIHGPAGGSGSGAGAGGADFAPRCSGVVSSEVVYRYTNVANQLVQLSHLRTLGYNAAGCLVVSNGPESSLVLGCIPCPESGGSGSDTSGSGGSSGGTCCTLPDTLTVAVTSACAVFNGASQTVTRTIGQNWNWSRAQVAGTYHQLSVVCINGLYTVSGAGLCSDGVTTMGFSFSGYAADCAAFSVTDTAPITGVTGTGATCCEGGTVTATAAL